MDENKVDEKNSHTLNEFKDLTYSNIKEISKFENIMEKDLKEKNKNQEQDDLQKNE